MLKNHELVEGVNFTHVRYERRPAHLDGRSFDSDLVNADGIRNPARCRNEFFEDFVVVMHIDDNVQALFNTDCQHPVHALKKRFIHGIRFFFQDSMFFLYSLTYLRSTAHTTVS